MDIPQHPKRSMDTTEYARRIQESRRNGDCWICWVADHTHGYSHHVVYEDENTIAFLNRFTPLRMSAH